MLREISRSALPVGDFELAEVHDDWGEFQGEEVRHVSSGYSFRVEAFSASNFHVQLSPGNGVHEERAVAANWRIVRGAVRAWITYLLRELEEPDLWAELLATNAIANVDPGDNGPLTPDEIRQIGTNVQAAKEFVVETGVAGAALDEVNRKLDYLVDSAERLGRFDWRTFALGMAFDIAVNVAFNPDQARRLFEIVVSPVQRLLTGG